MSPRLAVSTKIRPNVIILIHGFNSAPGRKVKQIQKYLSEKDQESQNAEFILRTWEA